MAHEQKYAIGEEFYYVDSGYRASVLEFDPESGRYVVETDLEEELNARVQAFEEELTRHADGSPDVDD